MAEPSVHLVVIAKSPQPGRVKTRMCPPYSLEQAAEIAATALRDTLAAVVATPALDRTLVLDGPEGGWLTHSLAVVPQRGDGLDQRLANAFEDAERRTPGPILLIGMDTPQVTPTLLERSSRTLVATAGAVIGPASDGGWWALGLHQANRGLLEGVPMSTSRTCQLQARRLRDHGLAISWLETLTDVDDADSADRVAREAPGTAFARSLGSLVVAR
jgi:hypothetical protein